MVAQGLIVSKKKDVPPVADQSAKIAGDVLRMARIIVAAGGARSVTVLLSDLCRPALVKMLKDLQSRGQLVPDEQG